MHTVLLILLILSISSYKSSHASLNSSYSLFCMLSQYYITIMHHSVLSILNRYVHTLFQVLCYQKVLLWIFCCIWYLSFCLHLWGILLAMRSLYMDIFLFFRIIQIDFQNDLDQFSISALAHLGVYPSTTPPTLTIFIFCHLLDSK